MGYLSLVACILIMGSYLVPARRFPHCSPWYFQWLISLGVFVSTTLLALVMGRWTFSFLGLLAGVLWSIGSMLSLVAIQKDGLARAASAWVGTGILTSLLMGMAVANESFASPFMGIAGLLLLTISLVLVVRLRSDGAGTGRVHATSLLTGLFFGSYMAPLKLSTLSELEFLPSMAIGILLAGVFIKVVLRPSAEKKARLGGFCSGVLWNIGNVACLVAVKELGLMIAFPLTQIALFVAILWGILLFREIPGIRKRLRLLGYAVGLFAGAVLIGLAG
jgi:glucose uptake protein GlcU